MQAPTFWVTNDNTTMEENSNYLPYFYFSILLLISCLAFASTFNNIDENVLQRPMTVSRCSYEICEPQVATLTVAVQDTQINSFKKTTAEKMRLTYNSSKETQPLAIDSVTVTKDIHSEMVAKSEWWIKRLIYDVRDISTSFPPPTEKLNAESATEDSILAVKGQTKPDKRIVDCISTI